ncbi:MAG: hypothetical protein C0501_23645 [Isosphaera sp.]|nr:hypothetical protein [Isosphaera sp.]
MRTVLPVLALILAAAPVPAAQPRKPADVAAAVDRVIDAKLAAAKVTASAASDDAEFLRRAALDLTGVVPTPEAAAAFLDSNDPDKRAKLVDALLADPHYARHFANVWYDRIIPRTPISTRIDPASLRAALREDFAANRPWGEQVARVVRCDGTPTANYLAFHRVNGDMGGIPMANVNARAFSRLFLGVRLECAECHDDPHKPWTQDQYWGLAAFFGRAVVDEKDRSFLRIAETTGYKTPKGSTFKLTPRPDGALTIHSEASEGVGKSMPPKVLGGEPLTFPVGKPMLPALAAWAASPDNPYLAKAAANRWWAHLLGRGLVDPVDDLRDDNPPSHPEVLDLLAAEFTASGHDLKHLIRCIALTKAYQRTSRAAAGPKPDEALFARMPLRPLTAEMLLDSLAAAYDVAELLPRNPPPPRRGQVAPLTRKNFVDLFNTNDPDGDPADYTHGIPQLLHLMNGPALNAGAARVEALLRAGAAPETVVETLYLATLSRRPTASELKRKLALAATHKTPRDGLNAVLWTLVNGAEFVVNH